MGRHREVLQAQAVTKDRALVPVPTVPDRIPRPCRALLIGINPGMDSARRRRHYAGASNRFWKLLAAAGITPRRFHWSEDALMTGLGYGLTNVVARGTPGIGDLRPEDWALGRKILARKIARVKPCWAVFIGVTAYRGFTGTKAPVACGPQPGRIAGARVWVVPSPSGKNANFTWAQLLREYRRLKEAVG